MPPIPFPRASLVAAVALLLGALAACASTATEPPTLPRPEVDLPLGAPGESRTAVVAGGCFWCVQGVFEQLAGVTRVVAGYAGGTAETATYERYHESGHAEAIQLTYDASRITYGQLLRVLFTAGDPTTAEGQEPDHGHGYRMAVFALDDDQKRIAEAYIRQLTAAKTYDRPIVAAVEALPLGFFPAEEHHQRFVAKHPDHPYVCRWSLEKIARIRAAFPADVLPAEQAPPNR